MQTWVDVIQFNSNLPFIRLGTMDIFTVLRNRRCKIKENSPNERSIPSNMGRGRLSPQAEKERYPEPEIVCSNKIATENSHKFFGSNNPVVSNSNNHGDFEPFVPGKTYVQANSKQRERRLYKGRRPVGKYQSTESSTSMKIIVLALCCVLTAAVTQRRLTDAEQQQAIDKLNEVRRRVANGEAINKDGNKLPPAADMQQLNVDTTFEDQAYTWVTGCNYDYQPNSNQLINAFDSLTSDYMGSLNAAIEQWYNSSHQFSGNVSKFQDDDNTDFTTLAWNTLNLTGCAVGLCPQLKNGDNYLNNFTFVACNFNAGSNWIGKPIYDPGTGCESCAYGYRCNNSLCYYDTQLPPRTPGWLTIGERKAVLDTVNGHRRDLANGNVTDANGKTLPTGSNILEVEYDIGLQSIAVNNFTECTSGFRDLADYNVLSIMLQGVETPDGQEYKGAFEYAINSWWYPKGYNNSISNYQGSSSNFAKLGWAKASKIGCNREICLFQQQNVTVSKIVCVLGEEKGAVIGQPIYSSGTTCSACPSGYSCSNSLCVKTVSECSVSD